MIEYSILSMLITFSYKPIYYGNKVGKFKCSRDWRIKASEETLIKSLEGNWREEQIFNLSMAYNHYVFLQNQLKECDIKSKETIKKMSNPSHTKKVDKIQKSKNNPDFNVSQYLYGALGVEVTKIYGIKEIAALSIFSETGIDLKV